MTQLSIQFGQDCPCGGRTGHPHNARTTKHEATKRHQRWVNQGQSTTRTTTQTTPKTDGSSTSASPSVSLKEAKV